MRDLLVLSALVGMASGAGVWIGRMLRQRDLAERLGVWCLACDGRLPPRTAHLVCRLCWARLTFPTQARLCDAVADSIRSVGELRAAIAQLHSELGLPSESLERVEPNRTHESESQ